MKSEEDGLSDVEGYRKTSLRNGMRYAKKFAQLTVILIASRAPSQQPKATADAARAKLQFLVGSFVTETTMPPTPSAPGGATGKGTSTIRWTLDSMFLSIDEQSTNTLFGRYQGRGMLGFDAPTHQYVLSMFNNFGDHPSYRGSFNGDTLVLLTTVPMPGRSFDQKVVWYEDGDGVRMRVLNDMGKGFASVLEQRATRVAKKGE